MALYQGVLGKLSSGDYHTRGSWVRREFVQIGDVHLRNVKVSGYLNAVLEDSLGEDVTLSVAGPGFRSKGSALKVVIAIRTPAHGVKRPNVLALGFAVLFQMVVYLLAAIGFALIAFVGGVIVNLIFDETIFKTYVVVAGIVIALTLLKPFMLGVRMVFAWAAIHGAPIVHRERSAV